MTDQETALGREYDPPLEIHTTIATPGAEVSQQLRLSRPQEVLTWLGLSAVLAYGWGYTAWYSFYGAFGLSPEQMGIAQLTLLGRLSMAALVILISCGVFAIVLMTPLGFFLWMFKDFFKGQSEPTCLQRFRKWSENWLRGNRLPLVIASLVAVTIALGRIIPGLSIESLEDLGNFIFNWWAVPFLIMVLVLLLVKRFTNRQSMIVVGATAVVVFSLMNAQTYGSNAAEQLRSKGIVDFNGTVMLGLHFSYVEATVAGSSNSAMPQSRPVILLSDSANQIIVFDCRSQEVFEEYSGNVHLRFLGPSSRWPEGGLSCPATPPTPATPETSPSKSPAY